jgi:predicted PurR-regulated permease PerM
MVWLPVSIFLLSTGQIFQGVFLAIYGLLVVSTIDNLIRPYIISKRSNLSVPVSIIGIIGGIMFFGITGIVLGPLILAYALIIIDFYKNGKLNELFTRETQDK